MVVSDFLGEGYFYADPTEAQCVVGGKYYIIHSRRMGDPLETGIHYSPSDKRVIEVDLAFIDTTDDVSILDPAYDLNQIFDSIFINWDGVVCKVCPLQLRREYPEEIHCGIEPVNQEGISPVGNGLGLVNALYNPFEDGHIISFGYKVNEDDNYEQTDDQFGYQFVQMEIQRMNPMERYLVLGIKSPNGTKAAAYENNLSALLHQPVDPFNRELENMEMEENPSWNLRTDTRGPQRSRLSTNNTEPKYIVFRKFAQERPWVQPPYHWNTEVDHTLSVYDTGIFPENPALPKGKHKFFVHVAERFQDIWTQEENGRLERMSAFVSYLSTELESFLYQFDAFAHAWEYHCKRFAEMAEEMRLGELAGGCTGDGLADLLQKHKKWDLEMKEELFKFVKKWSTRWKEDDVVRDVAKAV